MRDQAIGPAAWRPGSLAGSCPAPPQLGTAASRTLAVDLQAKSSPALESRQVQGACPWVLKRRDFSQSFPIPRAHTSKG